jgi:hypothetical protein
MLSLSTAWVGNCSPTKDTIGSGGQADKSQLPGTYDCSGNRVCAKLVLRACDVAFGSAQRNLQVMRNFAHHQSCGETLQHLLFAIGQFRLSGAHSSNRAGRTAEALAMSASGTQRTQALLPVAQSVDTAPPLIGE